MGAPSFSQVLLEQLDELEPVTRRARPATGPSLCALIDASLRRSELASQLPDHQGRGRHIPRLPARRAPSTPACLRLLGLSLPCSQADVRRAFRQQAFDAHPDRSSGTHGAFVALQQAYEDALGLLAA